MKKWIGLLAAGLTVAAGGMLASPAQAGTSHSGSGATLSGYSTGARPGEYSCVNVGRYSLSINPDAELAYESDWVEDAYWSADITITGPDGTSSAGYLYGDGDSSDSDTVFMCGYEKWRGRYDVEADIEIDGWDENCDYDDDCYDGSISTTDYVYTSFWVGATPPAHNASITGVHRAKSGAQGWAVSAHVNKNGKAWAGRTVQVQAKVDGRWKTIKTVRTGPGGNARWFGYGPGQHRFHITATGGFPARDSAVFWAAKRQLPHHASISGVHRVKAGDHGWTVTAQVNKNGKAWAGRTVQVQARTHGQWKTIKTVRTGPGGKARWFGYGAGQHRFHITATGGFPARSSGVFWAAKR